MDCEIKIIGNKDELGKIIHDMKNIALFGGSFNPPHFGHIEAMELALKKMDCILLFPHSYNTGQKDCMAPMNDRIMMLQIILSDFKSRNKNAVNVIAIVNPVFLHGYHSEYAISTINSLMGENRRLHILCGSDCVNDDYSQDIRHLPHLVHHHGEMDTRHVTGIISGEVTFLETTNDISSSEIRRLIRSGNFVHPCKPLQEFLVERKLYSGF